MDVFKAFPNLLKNKSVVVCCGGSTTLKDLEKTPEDAFRIDVNTNCAEFVDSIKMSVILDKYEASQRNAEKARKLGILVISPHEFKDYYINEYIIVNDKRLKYRSAIYAVYMAYMLGSDNIYVVGMDFYTGTPTHMKFSDIPFKDIMDEDSFKSMIKAWKDLREICPYTLITEDGKKWL